MCGSAPMARSSFGPMPRPHRRSTAPSSTSVSSSPPLKNSALPSTPSASPTTRPFHTAGVCVLTCAPAPTLLGGEHAVPSIRAVRLTPFYEALPSALADEQPPVAPTWKLHATREGLVGRHTANGHRITQRDHFVSLPSWRSLSPEGTNQYMVRVTYNGRSSVAPVYDVGPWNVHDNYWDEKRQIYADLPRRRPHRPPPRRLPRHPRRPPRRRRPPPHRLARSW